MLEIRSKKGAAILTSIILVSGLTALMGRFITIAVPSIQREFGSNLSEMQWVMNVNVIVIASLLMITGTLGDKFGLKRVFCLGILVFALGAFASAFSPSVVVLICFQGICGLGIVLMTPGCIGLISRCFQDEEKTRATAIWVGISAYFGVIGLLLGGILIQRLGWRIPLAFIGLLAILTFLIALKLVPKTDGDLNIKVKGIHAFLLAVGLIGLSYFLIHFEPAKGLNSKLVFSVMTFLLAFGGFIFFQYRSKTPLIPREILKERKLVWSNVATFFIYFTLNGLYLYAIVNFQEQYNFTPTEAGLSLLPPSLMVAVFAGPFGKVLSKVKAHVLIAFGSLLAGIGFALLSSPGDSAEYLSEFLLPLLLIGLGMALFVTPITKSAMSGDIRYAGAASGLNNTVARVSGLLAVALLGSLWLGVYNVNLETKLDELSISETTKLVVMKQPMFEDGLGVDTNFENEIGEIRMDSLNAGFKSVMLVSALCCFLAAVLAFLFVRYPKPIA